MRRSVHDYRPSENWQHSEQDYYLIYLPSNLSHFVPAPRSLNPREQRRDPWWLFEERPSREPNYGLTSLPYVAPTRPSVPLFLIDEHDTYPGAWDPVRRTYAPQYDQGSTEDEDSRLSPQEQEWALNKLRKQLYSPHINNIIRRLGTKYSGSSNAGRSVQEDDETKRCAICLDDFVSRQFATITPCNHMFHEDCIVPWIKSHGKCPVCRFIMF
ncbi:hypothetical protein OROHE_010722 [Orobanche hederae]